MSHSALVGRSTDPLARCGASPSRVARLANRAARARRKFCAVGRISPRLVQLVPRHVVEV